MQKASNHPQFLNLDLELYSDQPPARLLSEFGESVITLFSGENHRPYPGQYMVSLELTLSRGSEIERLQCFLKLITQLSDAGKREWQTLKERVFDFGYGVHAGMRINTLHLPDTVIAQMASVQGSAAISTYLHQPSQWNVSTSAR